MRKVYVKPTGKMVVNKSYQAISIEKEMQKITETKEPIKATSPEMFTERKQGVLPETDIRTDRFEIAREAMDKVSKTQIAKREQAFKTDEKPGEPTQATGEEK